MCSVGDSFGVEIDTEVRQYEFNNCGKTFKSIGSAVSCPKCFSKDVKQVD